VIDQSSPDDALLGHVVIDLDNLDVEHGYRGSFPLADMVNFLFTSTCSLLFYL